MKTLVKRLNVVINDSSLPVQNFNETPVLTDTEVSTATGLRARLLNAIGELDLCQYEAEVYFHADCSSFAQFNIGVVSDDQYSDWIFAEEGELLLPEWNSEIAPNLPTSRVFTLNNTLSVGAFALAENFKGTADISIWKVAE